MLISEAEPWTPSASNRGHPRRRPGHAAPAAHAAAPQAGRPAAERPVPRLPARAAPPPRRHRRGPLVLVPVDDVRRAMGDGAALGVRPALRGRGRAARHRRRRAQRRRRSSAGAGRSCSTATCSPTPTFGACSRFHATAARARPSISSRVPDPTPYGLVELGERRPRRALSREAEARGDHDQHDQRGHLPARRRAPRRGSRPTARCRSSASSSPASSPTASRSTAGSPTTTGSTSAARRSTAQGSST